ncbi:MAG TPA: kelch repeat-containing protein, partial [Anaerolineae bacterium]|nr:kelch repeat-containing protein [Anaerolineae bacterium]
MKRQLLTLALAVAFVAACGPAPAPTQAPAPTSPPPPAAPIEPTRPVMVPTSAGISPPGSGGPAIVPTKAAAATPLAGQVPAGRTAPGWKRLDTANPPPARFDYTLALDAASRKLVLFGGRDGSQTLGDTWVFDLASSTWREVKASPSPGARFGHSATYDPKSKRVLIFAG